MMESMQRAFSAFEYMAMQRAFSAYEYMDLKEAWLEN